MGVTILLIYLAIVFAIAYYYSRKSTSSEYFLNNRKTGLLLLTLASFGTLIGGGAVAVIGEVYMSGIGTGLALPLALGGGAIVFSIFGKRIRELGQKYDATTLVDFFEKRFDRKTGTLAAILQSVIMLLWIATQAVAAASLLVFVLNISYPLAITFAALFTVLYTAIGGLKVDLITDMIPSFIIIIVFVWLSITAIRPFGTIKAMIDITPASHLDPFTFGGIAWFIGIILVGGFVFLGNATHWQRIMAAKDAMTVRKSFLILFPIIFVFCALFLLLGTAAVNLIEQETTELVIFTLMEYLLPTQLLGIGFAAILAVVMSSVDSLIVTAATIIHHQWLPKKGLSMARFLAMGVGILGFLLALFIPDIITLGLLTSYTALLFIPSIIAALYTKKKSKPVFWGLIFGLVTLLIAYPFLGKNAFLPMLLVSSLVTIMKK